VTSCGGKWQQNTQKYHYVDASGSKVSEGANMWMQVIMKCQKGDIMCI